jgi:hypothetical protein
MCLVIGICACRSKQTYRPRVQINVEYASAAIDCIENWQYEDLVLDFDSVEVLIFRPEYRISIQSSPAIVIFRYNNDILGLVDKDFRDKTLETSCVRLTPSNWSKADKRVLCYRHFGQIQIKPTMICYAK